MGAQAGGRSGYPEGCDDTTEGVSGGHTTVLSRRGTVGSSWQAQCTGNAGLSLTLHLPSTRA